MMQEREANRSTNDREREADRNINDAGKGG